MNDNPYQSPRESNDSDADVDKSPDMDVGDWIRKSRDAQRSWSQRCWWIGALSIIAGLAGVSYSHAMYVKGMSRFLVGLLDVASIGSVIFGAVAIVFGPISWFWFRHKP